MKIGLNEFNKLKEIFAIEELFKIELKKINNSISELKKKFFNEKNQKKKFKSYAYLIKEINKLIKKIKINSSYSFIINVFMADNNDKVFYQEELLYSPMNNNVSINETLSLDDVQNNFEKYLTNDLYPLNTLTLEFIQKINNLNTDEWINGNLFNKNIWSYKSGNTTSFMVKDDVTYNVSTTNNFKKIFFKNPVNGLTSYGIQFNSGFNGTIKFTSIPKGLKFGILGVGNGGANGKYFENVDKLYYTGGGGGGIYYNSNIDYSQILLNNNYKISVGYNLNKNTSFDFIENIVCRGGGDGSSINKTGGIGGNTIPITSFSYNGGNGGNGDLENGSNSELIFVEIPCSSSKIYLGGGGGTFDEIKNCELCSSNYANGGNGFGGITYSNNSSITSNPNGYSGFKGGNYGGGASGSYIISNKNNGQFLLDGGPGVVIIWWQ